MFFHCFSPTFYALLEAQWWMGSASRKSISSISIVYKLYETCAQRERKTVCRTSFGVMTHASNVCVCRVPCVCVRCGRNSTDFLSFTTLRAMHTLEHGNGMMKCTKQLLCIYFVSLNKYIRMPIQCARSNHELRVWRCSPRVSVSTLCICMLKNSFAFIYNLPRISWLSVSRIVKNKMAKSIQQNDEHWIRRIFVCVGTYSQSHSHSHSPPILFAFARTLFIRKLLSFPRTNHHHQQ